MSGRLDYARRKRREAGRRGERIIVPRDRSVIPGWRTEYPEQFPVTVTRKADDNGS